MGAASLERRLLGVYKQAIRQRNWVVADHLLSAIEACVGTHHATSAILIEAYGELAAGAMATAPPPTESPSSR